jgi:16S rRNA (uracil1498-N3)-methyltransferase
LRDGDEVDLFDSDGLEAKGVLRFVGSKDLAATVGRLDERRSPSGLQLIVASAVPKGERADWMIEKLSELGVALFIPLATERSVVKPEGKNKLERWTRIATESAKQSRRSGVMRIGELQPLAEVVQENPNAVYLSTESDAKSILAVLSDANARRDLTLFVGPEGGWAIAEIELFGAADIQGVKLTSTVLRIETAAIAGAAIATLLLHPPDHREDLPRSREDAKKSI